MLEIKVNDVVGTLSIREIEHNKILGLKGDRDTERNRKTLRRTNEGRETSIFLGHTELGEEEHLLNL